MSEAPAQGPAGPEPSPRHLLMLFGGIALVLAILVLGWEQGVRDRVPKWIADIPYRDAPHTPWGTRRWDLRLGDLATFMGFGLVGYGFVRRFEWSQGVLFQRIVHVVLVTALLASSFVYFYARRAQLPTYVNVDDSYQQLMGARYYERLQYDRLYDCTVEALGEEGVPDKVRVRNLRTHVTQRAAQARERAGCEAQFGPEAWASFKADVDDFAQFGSPDHLWGMLDEYGYDGPPFHAAVAGTLARGFDLSLPALNRWALFDQFGLLLMLAIITWAFGWKLGMVFAIFFLTSFADRSDAVGASFLRVQWMVCLGVAIALLHRQHYGWAGALLVLAAMLNAFPVVFALAILAKIAVQLGRERELSPDYRHFLKGVAITAAVCSVLSIAYGKGPSNYSNYLEYRSHHEEGPPMKDGSPSERIAPTGIGLKYTFLYRGEHYSKGRKLPNATKTTQFREVEWVYRSTGVTLVLLSLLIALRLEDFEGCVLVGFVALFCLQGTPGHHFACASLVIVMWQKRAATPSGLLMLAAFFSCSWAGHITTLKSASPYVAHNSAMSFAWLAYILVTLALLGRETGLYADLSRRLFAPSPEASTQP